MTKQTKQPERIDTEIDNMIGDLIKRKATPADMSNFIHHLLLQTRQQTLEEVDENTSDGYHTFKELYEFRKLYNAALFNEWYSQGKYNVHKSWKHHDGEECFGGGWFIVVATLPTGQISNHYEEKDWDLFRVVAKDRADEWDGHTSQDVAKRLLNQLKEKK